MSGGRVYEFLILNSKFLIAAAAGAYVVRGAAAAGERSARATRFRISGTL
jgi:hypothetical protein